jgi:para-aminobenzoate synthetase component 1
MRLLGRIDLLTDLIFGILGGAPQEKSPMMGNQPTNPFSSVPRVEPIEGVDAEILLDSIGSNRSGFLFESGLDVSGTGRWHLAGIDPIGSFEARRDHWILEHHNGEQISGEGDPLEALDRWWSGWSRPKHQDDSASNSCVSRFPFVGGAVGWIGYEAADVFLGLPPRQVPQGPVAQLLEGVPEMSWRLYDEVVVIDAIDGGCWFLHHERDGWQDRRWWLATDRQQEADSCRVRIEDASLNDEDYLAAVEQIRQRIGSGDVYEVNLARGLLLDGVPPARDLHRLWRAAQPVPYGAFIQGDPVSVVSASPELFLRRRGDRIVTRPIKGTVPRHGDERLDTDAARRLLQDEKERAELAMIVDLERNDLGRICRPGSVEVKVAAEVESYASVLHTVATIEGRLRANPSPAEILRATFPGGSITGAPKVAAMEQIRQLEPWPRSVYTGSLGWIAPCGDLELSIAIRTALVRGQRALIPFGGAVTWDSNPSSERAELTHKARAMFDALGI